MVVKGNQTTISRSKSGRPKRRSEESASICRDLNEGDERRVKSGEILESQANLRELSAKLIHAYEEERRRVAHEVHENLAQAFIAIQLRVETALSEMKDNGHTKSREILAPVVYILQDGIDSVRRIAARLRPLILDDLGILMAISRLCRELSSDYPGVSIEKRFKIEESEIPEPLKVVIYRILESALYCILKQQPSGLVEIGLGRSRALIFLTIRAHGGALDPDLLSGGDILGRSDLTTIGERAMLSGGTLTVARNQEGGTTLQVEWPLRDFSRSLSRAQVRGSK